ncbi:hypothetical protein ACI2L4_37625, partial [Streptomyces sparsogenes]
MRAARQTCGDGGILTHSRPERRISGTLLAFRSLSKHLTYGVLMALWDRIKDSAQTMQTQLVAKKN